MVTWDRCRDYFEVDGSLRDIYIVGGRLESWRACMRVLLSTTPSFEVGGERRLVPMTVEEAFELSRDNLVVLRVTWRGVLVCCHFFDPDQVELDIAPQDIDSADRFSAILDFMKELARESGKRVVLTPENQYERPLLEATPIGEVSDVGN